MQTHAATEEYVESIGCGGGDGGGITKFWITVVIWQAEIQKVDKIESKGDIHSFQSSN